jgi:hypothetical protein
MASCTGKSATPSNELIIYEPPNWDIVYRGKQIKCPSPIVSNPPAWIIQLFSRLQKAEENVRKLAEEAADKNGMEIEVEDLWCNSEILSDGAVRLFWDIAQKISLNTSHTEERFKHIVTACQIFGSAIWTAIGRL